MEAVALNLFRKHPQLLWHQPVIISRLFRTSWRILRSFDGVQIPDPPSWTGLWPLWSCILKLKGLRDVGSTEHLDEDGSGSGRTASAPGPPRQMEREGPGKMKTNQRQREDMRDHLDSTNYQNNISCMSRWVHPPAICYY